MEKTSSNGAAEGFESSEGLRSLDDEAFRAWSDDEVFQLGRRSLELLRSYGAWTSQRLTWHEYGEAPCTTRLPVVGDEIGIWEKAFGPDAAGNEDAWRLAPGEVAIVTAVGNDGNYFSLRNPSGLESTFLFRGEFFYQQAFLQGQRVEYRDSLDAWGAGVVTCTTPLKVRPAAGESAEHEAGSEWAEVRASEDDSDNSASSPLTLARRKGHHLRTQSPGVSSVRAGQSLPLELASLPEDAESPEPIEAFDNAESPVPDNLKLFSTLHLGGSFSFVDAGEDDIEEQPVNAALPLAETPRFDMALAESPCQEMPVATDMLEALVAAAADCNLEADTRSACVATSVVSPPIPTTGVELVSSGPRHHADTEALAAQIVKEAVQKASEALSLRWAAVAADKAPTTEAAHASASVLNVSEVTKLAVQVVKEAVQKACRLRRHYQQQAPGVVDTSLLSGGAIQEDVVVMAGCEREKALAEIPGLVSPVPGTSLAAGQLGAGQLPAAMVKEALQKAVESLCLSCVAVAAEKAPAAEAVRASESVPAGTEVRKLAACVVKEALQKVNDALCHSCVVVAAEKAPAAEAVRASESVLARTEVKKLTACVVKEALQKANDGLCRSCVVVAPEKAPTVQNANEASRLSCSAVAAGTALATEAVHASVSALDVSEVTKLAVQVVKEWVQKANEALSLSCVAVAAEKALAPEAVAASESLLKVSEVTECAVTMVHEAVRKASLSLIAAVVENAPATDAVHPLESSFDVSEVAKLAVRGVAGWVQNANDAFSLGHAEELGAKAMATYEAMYVQVARQVCERSFSQALKRDRAIGIAEGIGKVAILLEVDGTPPEAHQRLEQPTQPDGQSMQQQQQQQQQQLHKQCPQERTGSGGIRGTTASACRPAVPACLRGDFAGARLTEAHARRLFSIPVFCQPLQQRAATLEPSASDVAWEAGIAQLQAETEEVQASELVLAASETTTLQLGIDAVCDIRQWTTQVVENATGSAIHNVLAEQELLGVGSAVSVAEASVPLLVAEDAQPELALTNVVAQATKEASSGVVDAFPEVAPQTSVGVGKAAAAAPAIATQVTEAHELSKEKTRDAVVGGLPSRASRDADVLARKSASDSTLPTENSQESGASFYSQWKLPERVNLVYFKTPWEERFATAVMSQEYLGDNIIRQKASPRRQQRPHTGYSLGQHHCKEEARAAYYVFKGSPAAHRAFLSAETPSVLGPGATDEELPAAFLDSTDPNTSAPDAGNLETVSRTALNPRRPVGSTPKATRPGLERLRRAPSTEVEAWTQLRGSASSAKLPPSEPPSSVGKGSPKLCRLARPGGSRPSSRPGSQGRCVLNFPICRGQDSQFAAESSVAPVWASPQERDRPHCHKDLAVLPPVKGHLRLCTPPQDWRPLTSVLRSSEYRQAMHARTFT